MGIGINTASLEITPAPLSLIATIDEFKGARQAVGRIAPERLSAQLRLLLVSANVRFDLPGAFG